MRVTDITGSAPISAPSVVFLLLYQAMSASTFLLGKCCSHDYHVAWATQERNDNSSLSHHPPSHAQLLTHFLSVFLSFSCSPKGTRQLWPASISWPRVWGHNLDSGNERWKTAERVFRDTDREAVLCRTALTDGEMLEFCFHGRLRNVRKISKSC